MKNLIIITIAVLVPALIWSMPQPAAAQEEPPTTATDEGTTQASETAPITDTPDAPSDPNDATAPETTTIAEVTIVPDNGDGILLNFKNAPLETILDHLSEVVGLVIVSDAEIDGRLTIISRQPLTIEEVVSLINTALIKEDYAAIKMGRTLKIVPLDDAKKMNIPVQSGNDPEEVTPGDDMVTHVIPVRFASAVKLKEELSELVPSYADLAANAETNTLIITDTTANVRRFIEIVRALDTQMSAIAEVKVFHLKYSDAANTARLINEVFQPDEQSSRSSRGNRQSMSPMERMMSFRGRGGDRSRGRGGDESQSEASPATKIVASADEYTNTLVVAGSAETLELVETVIKELDSNPQEEQSVMVYPLQNAQAENLKDVLNNLFQQMAQLLYNQGGGSGRGGGGSSRFGRSGGMGFSSGRSSGSSALSGAGNLAGQVYFESDEDTNSLLIITASKNFDKVKKIIDELDKPVPQVLIKVLIAEVTHDESLDLAPSFPW